MYKFENIFKKGKRLHAIITQNKLLQLALTNAIISIIFRKDVDQKFQR